MPNAPVHSKFFKLILMTVCLLFAGCSDQGILEDTPLSPDNNESYNLDAFGGGGDNGSGTLTGYDAVVASIAYYEARRDTSTLSEQQERVLTSLIRQERYYRQLGSGIPTDFNERLQSGMILPALEGDTPIPASLDIQALTHNAHYPFLVFSAEYGNPEVQSDYRYNLRPLQISPDDLQDAVLYKPYEHQISVFDDAGQVVYHLQAWLPGKQILANQYIASIEENLRERYGTLHVEGLPIGKQSPLPSKLAHLGASNVFSKLAKGRQSCEEIDTDIHVCGECVYYGNNTDGITAYCPLDVEGEYSGGCTQDGNCEHDEQGGGSPSDDNLPYNEPVDPTLPNTCQTCPTGQNGPSGHGNDAIVEFSASLVKAAEIPPTDDWNGSQIEIRASHRLFFEPPSSATSVQISGSYELRRQTSYLQGVIEFQDVGLDISASLQSLMEAGVGLTIPVLLDGAGTVQRESWRIIETGDYTQNGQGGSYPDGSQCTYQDLSIEWEWDVRPKLEVITQAGHLHEYNPGTDARTHSKGGKCYYRK